MIFNAFPSSRVVPFRPRITFLSTRASRRSLSRKLTRVKEPYSPHINLYKSRVSKRWKVKLGRASRGTKTMQNFKVCWAHWIYIYDIWYIYIWLNWNSNGMIYQSVARKFDVRVSVNMWWLKDSSVATRLFFCDWGKLWSSLAVVRMAKVEACSLTTSHNHGVRFPRGQVLSPQINISFHTEATLVLKFEASSSWWMICISPVIYWTQLHVSHVSSETPIISAQTWGSTDG